MFFFDDPRLKNLEIDRLDRPLGAGQGFYGNAHGPRMVHMLQRLARGKL